MTLFPCWRTTESVEDCGLAQQRRPWLAQVKNCLMEGTSRVCYIFDFSKEARNLGFYVKSLLFFTFTEVQWTIKIVRYLKYATWWFTTRIPCGLFSFLMLKTSCTNQPVVGWSRHISWLDVACGLSLTIGGRLLICTLLEQNLLLTLVNDSFHPSRTQIFRPQNQLLLFLPWVMFKASKTNYVSFPKFGFCGTVTVSTAHSRCLCPFVPHQFTPWWLFTVPGTLPLRPPLQEL